jgi:Ca2+-binding EF-hand superfamily protein
MIEVIKTSGTSPKEVFKSFDNDGDGNIDKHEMKQALESIFFLYHFYNQIYSISKLINL